MKPRYILVIFFTLLLTGCRPDLLNNNAPAVNFGNSGTININQYVNQPIKPVNQNINNNATVNAAKPSVPKQLDYPVVFASQAPYGVWDALHEEACEEAAMIMAAKFFNKEPLSAHLMEQGILDLVKWEENSGYQIDLTAAEARDILINYFKLKAKLVSDVTPTRIKEELAKGGLIIIPAAGRDLKNPYFQTPGPIYHMLVIRGYNESEFITNDPGTRRGEGFKYKYQQLIYAIHDWNHDFASDGVVTEEEIRQGEKVIVVVSK